MSDLPRANPQLLGIEPGSIFYASWGYDQTNVDFLQVVRTTPTGVWLRSIAVRSVDDSHVEPIKSLFTQGPPARFQQVINERPTLAWTSYRRARAVGRQAEVPNARRTRTLTCISL